jgi:hypothetical protein
LPSPLAAAWALVLTLLLGGGLWLSQIPYPLAGEPVVTLAIPPVKELKTAATDPAKETPAEEPAAAPEETAEIETPPETQDEATIVVAGRRPLRPAPVAAVTEATGDGPLPRVASGGKRPFDVYARTVPLGVAASDRPKIAILLGGMGLNRRLTEKAIDELPGDVTLGFAPYGKELQHQVNEARAAGHEIMLQLPMEPNGYPAADPGPNTLLAEGAKADNLAALRWHMSRFAGYTGITNYMGSRFLAAPEAMQPVLAEMKARGIVFLEDAAITTSAVAAVAKATGLSARHGDLVIDADPDAAAIAAALAGLEEKARAAGFAIGTGTGLAITIEAVAEWAKELESRGILLVPVSAAYRGRIG